LEDFAGEVNRTLSQLLCVIVFLDKVSILTKKKQNNSKRKKIRKLKGRQLQQSIP
jgi:hypothetical protein